MSKQKLVDLVLQKMQEKKQKQERNRPHIEVLQLMARFEAQECLRLQQQVDRLSRTIHLENQNLKKLQQCNTQLQNTGKKAYPRIVIKPEFIASEHVQPLVKQFYRKAANTFLREEILKRKQNEHDLNMVKEINQGFLDLKEKQQIKQVTQANSRREYNQKRLRNLKEDLRLRSIRAQQERIRKTIEQEKQSHRSLLNEYEIKKVNYDNRVEYHESLLRQIQKQKNVIEKAYNPEAYRDYLKKIFNIRTKNQALQKNLGEVKKKLAFSQENIQKKVSYLEKNDNLFSFGKIANSPSKKKRLHSSSGYSERDKTQVSKLNNLLQQLKKSVIVPSPMHSQTTATPLKNSLLMKSLGKTTASSLSNLKNSRSIQRRSSTMSTQLKRHSKMLF